MLSKLEVTGHVFSVWHSLGTHRDEVRLMLLGAYRCKDHTIVLFRYPASGLEAPSDGLMELVGNGGVKPIHDERLCLHVESDDWDTFAKLKDGAQFKLGKHMWTKLGGNELHQLVTNKTFHAI